MRTEAVRAQLAARGLGDRYREFTVSSATVALAAEALHCEAGRIAKTLSILTSTGPVLVVTMGLARLDNRKFKDLFHEKARFIPVEDVERLTGHPQGGVCPFALPEGVRVFLDESLRRYDVVYPAAGAPNNAVQLTPDELAAVTGGQWVDLCKLPEELAWRDPSRGQDRAEEARRRLPPAKKGVHPRRMGALFICIPESRHGPDLTVRPCGGAARS